jgi:DNA-directed RNA polymerase subunit RPC12/RpoP
MDTMLIALLPALVPFAFILYHALRAVKCPDCGATLPTLTSPLDKTRRMWRAGGYLCAQCGCETDLSGQKVTAKTPPVPFPTLQWALLAIALLVGVGLGAAGVLLGRTAAAAPVLAAPVVTEPIVAPPAVVLPQPALEMIQVN